MRRYWWRKWEIWVMSLSVAAVVFLVVSLVVGLWFGRWFGLPSGAIGGATTVSTLLIIQGLLVFPEDVRKRGRRAMKREGGRVCMGCMRSLVDVDVDAACPRCGAFFTPAELEAGWRAARDRGYRGLCLWRRDLERRVDTEARARAAVEGLALERRV